jgi:hypothetical protein
MVQKWDYWYKVVKVIDLEASEMIKYCLYGHTFMGRNECSWEHLRCQGEGKNVNLLICKKWNPFAIQMFANVNKKNVPIQHSKHSHYVKLTNVNAR